MTKGHLIFAQNSDVDYVRQAYALALTIKKYNTINNVCLVTNDIIPENYKHVFDYVVNIPFGDSSSKTIWKIENRWKLIYATPFDETIVYDSDMLLLDSNDSWWNKLSNKDLAFTYNVKDYRGNTIKDHSMRRCIVDNKLPDIYFGIHYFKKHSIAFEFYKWLEIITKNYKQFYNKFTPICTQNFCSMDVSSAIALKILDNPDTYTNNPMSFTHMKKQIQGWPNIPSLWTNAVIANFADNGQLFLSNNLQSGVFHYTEEQFLTDKIIQTIEKL